MNELWEDLISLNSNVESKFSTLEPAIHYWEENKNRKKFAFLDYKTALEKDKYPLPEIKDREGYYREDHFGYWAGGFQDATNILEAPKKHKVDIRTYLDFGCATGRVMRHIAIGESNIRTLGCDINRLHVEWCNTYLPVEATVFQNHSIPNLPLPDASVDLVSAFSVFTHIEALETTWLMELERILSPGGLAWITVHTDNTLFEMNEGWPLWKAVMNHPDRHSFLGDDRSFDGNRLVIRWRKNRSYSSNVFYKQNYLEECWGRFFEILEIRRRFPRFQDVILLKKRV